MVDDHQQRTAQGLVIAFPILGGIAILLRLWGRSLSRTKLASGTYGSLYHVDLRDRPSDFYAPAVS